MHVWMRENRVSPITLTAISIISTLIGFIPLLIPVVRGIPIENADIILSLLLIIVGDKIVDHLRDKLASNEITDIIASVKSTFNCEYIGRSNSAIIRVSQSIPRSIRVRNTHVNFMRGDAFEYSIDIEEGFQKAAIAFFKTGDALWEDAIGGQLGVWYKRFYTVLTEHPAARWSVHQLSDDFPIINFVILDFEDRMRNPSEVYFGWGHHERDPVGEVFLCRDTRVVRLFEEYFATLQISGNKLSPQKIKEILISEHKVNHGAAGPPT